MKKEVAVGIQDFEKLRMKDCFYIDKTDLIRKWWDGNDEVTLITRPRRFGKTLNMSMLNCFFSTRYAGRSDLFEGLCVWEDEKYRKLQGTHPVLALSFAGVKFGTFEDTRKSINGLIARLYNEYDEMLKDARYTEADRKRFYRVSDHMDDATAAASVRDLCEWLYRYHGKKVLILLDEYDTPMQEAWLHGFWDEMVTYIRALFNNTFKTNSYMERAVMTGITRVSRESIFSDLNNLTVVTVSSKLYATDFGFTEEEVFQALEAQGFDEEAKRSVKKWYDGFTFGNVTDIYNPWSVTCYLNEGLLKPYWANTSANGLISRLVRKSSGEIKMQFEELLNGNHIRSALDEQVVFNLLDEDPSSIWSLMLASGYLRIDDICQENDGDLPVYRLSVTNLETRQMFSGMVKGWFAKSGGLSGFMSLLLKGDLRGMNRYMNDLALSSMSYFDTGNSPSSKEPENFYHGLVLGLLVENASDYLILSNRESGYGRYDVVLEPRDRKNVAVIIEFKVFDREDGEASLEDTAANALRQIEDKKYETELLSRGIPASHIRKYGMAFQGKRCLIQTSIPIPRHTTGQNQFLDKAGCP